jgi:hypothetical protein
MLDCLICRTYQHLGARCSAWDILALAADLSTSDRDTLPGPRGARSASTKDIDVRCARLHGTCNTVEREISDRYSGSRGTCGRTILVILLDHNSVFSDSRECNVLVSDRLHCASGIVDGLYANPVLGVLDGGRFNCDVFNSVVGTASH